VSNSRSPGRYVCQTCGHEVRRDDHADPLAVARNHACEGESEVRFDAGLARDDYTVDFDG